MSKTSVILTYLVMPVLLLCGCAGPAADASTDSSVSSEAQPLSEVASNTNPRDGWVELEPAPMPYGPVYISIKCQGTTLLYVSQSSYLGDASTVVTANASECVG